MHTAMGGAGWSADALLAGVRAWATQQHLVISEQDQRDALLRLVVPAADGREAWLIVESRGEDVLQPLRRLGGFLSHDAGRSVRLVSTGADDGSGTHTVVGYRDWRIGSDGSIRPRRDALADTWMRENNPVPDDCPHEDFWALFELLFPGPEPDGEGERFLSLSAPPLDDDARISRIKRAALCADSVKIEPAPDGRVVLVMRGEQVTETVFVSPEEAKRISALL